MTFNAAEKHQSQVPALQLLVALGFTPLSQEEALRLRGGRLRNVVLDDDLSDSQILRRFNTSLAQAGAGGGAPQSRHCAASRAPVPEAEGRGGLGGAVGLDTLEDPGGALTQSRNGPGCARQYS